MVPEKLVIWQPHGVSYALHEKKWYKVLANYGGGRVLLSPTPASFEEVRHEKCDQKPKCERVVFRKNETGKMSRVWPRPWDPPPKVRKLEPPKTRIELGPRAMVAIVACCLTVVAIVIVPHWEPKVRAQPPTGQDVRVGQIYHNNDGWWRIQELFPEEELNKDRSKMLRFKALQQAQIPTAKVSLKNPGEADKVVYLSLLPAKPPTWTLK